MTFIIAEIGVNWNGDLNLAQDMIKQAKISGCDAVKFQSYDTSTVKDHPEFELLMKCTVSKENIEEIHDFAKSSNIDWMCTPMYPEAVSFIDPYVKKFKIREFDARLLLENKTSPLLENIFSTKKNIFASSYQSPKHSNYYSNSLIKWLYCVPKYPCMLDDLDYTCIHEFDGYSNHCPNIAAPIKAAALGAEIIEIHITSDKSVNFIDNNVSFDYNELDYITKTISNMNKINS